ncbi:MAG: hypothetical protein WCG27_05250 [Pseudomonadota bacterium]
MLNWLTSLLFVSLVTFQATASIIDYDGGDVALLRVFPQPFIWGLPSIAESNRDIATRPGPDQGVQLVISVVLKTGAFDEKYFKGIGFYVNRGSFDFVHSIYPQNDGSHQDGRFISKREFYSNGDRLLKDGTHAIEFLFIDFYHYAPGGTWFSPSSYVKPYALFDDGQNQYRIWDNVGSDYFITTTTHFDRSDKILLPKNRRSSLADCWFLF